MAFIEKTDFPSSVHDDILTALTRDNDDVITENVSRSVDEMKAYLNGRYDIAVIFTATGDDRNKFLVRLACSISLYWIYTIHNPRKLTQIIITNYENAIKTLEGIQKGTINPDGLPVPQTEENSGTGAPIQWGGETAMESSW